MLQLQPYREPLAGIYGQQHNLDHPDNYLTYKYHDKCSGRIEHQEPKGDPVEMSIKYIHNRFRYPAVGCLRNRLSPTISISITESLKESKK